MPPKRATATPVHYLQTLSGIKVGSRMARDVQPQLPRHYAAPPRAQVSKPIVPGDVVKSMAASATFVPLDQLR